jgi:hypothetical protein
MYIAPVQRPLSDPILPEDERERMKQELEAVIAGFGANNNPDLNDWIIAKHVILYHICTGHKEIIARVNRLKDLWVQRGGEGWERNSSVPSFKEAVRGTQESELHHLQNSVRRILHYDKYVALAKEIQFSRSRHEEEDQSLEKRGWQSG